ncbi:hypothetical protein ACWENQ_36020 [Nonomuraea sp. NPDC004354]
MNTRHGSAVPMALLADPVERATALLRPSLCGLWAEGLAALRAVVAAVGSGSGRPVRQAAVATDTVARSLAAAVPLPDPSAYPPPVPVHSDYFRIRHAPLTAEQQATTAAILISRMLADLDVAMLDPNDLLCEVESMITVMELLRPQPSHELADPSSESAPESWYVPGGDWMDRWFLAHHYYFLLNLLAAERLDRAAELARDGRDEPAAAAMDQAAVLVRGFTAAMVHSCAFPARYYLDVVRPTMAPPHVRTNLTGVMQLEHRRYRAALGRLLEELPAPYDELAARAPALAEARNAVLEADLIDLERHVIVADTMVGGERSLVQPGTTVQNAASTLRKMRHLRAAAYCQYMRFGDRWVTATSRRPDEVTTR